MADEEVSYGLSGSNLNLHINLSELPKCGKCNDGSLLPITDETRMGNIISKGWFCPTCNYNIMFKYGELVSQTEIVQVEPKDSRGSSEL